MNSAKGLYRLSFDRSEVEEAEKIYFLTPALQNTMENPIIPYEKKADILERVFSKEDVPEKLIRFFQVMCKHNESGEMKEIFKEYYRYRDGMENIVRAEYICTTSSTKEEEDEAKKILAEKYSGSTIDWKKKTDDTLLGGYVLKVGNVEYDKSYKGRLKQLEDRITGR